MTLDAATVLLPGQGQSGFVGAFVISDFVIGIIIRIARVLGRLAFSTVSSLGGQVRKLECGLVTLEGVSVNVCRETRAVAAQFFGDDPERHILSASEVCRRS